MFVCLFVCPCLLLFVAMPKLRPPVAETMESSTIVLGTHKTEFVTTKVRAGARVRGVPPVSHTFSQPTAFGPPRAPARVPPRARATLQEQIRCSCHIWRGKHLCSLHLARPACRRSVEIASLLSRIAGGAGPGHLRLRQCEHIHPRLLQVQPRVCTRQGPPA